MNYAFTNGKILDGSRDMQVQTGRCILVKNGKIHDIVSDTTDLSGYTKIDLKGHFPVSSICTSTSPEAESRRKSSVTMKNW